jgi:Na+/H+ antiporter NhaD/arsenite permease-like protein
MHAPADSGPLLLGVPLLFLLFGATLVGVVTLHRRSLEVALAGLAIILCVRLGFSRFDLGAHLRAEWVKLTNLLALLLGFSLLGDHFERSHLPVLLPRILPRGVAGCFALLALIWLLSGALDNIAAAMIGATTAAGIFRRRVHLGYLVAIVAAANAGGAGSVLGDTTTTMIWLGGVSPLAVLPAYIGAVTALLVFGTFASIQQHRHAPIEVDDVGDAKVDQRRLAIVVAALVTMVTTNIIVNRLPPPLSEAFPFLGAALWMVLLAGQLVGRPLKWKLVPVAGRSSLFLLALVVAASLMPVGALPRPSSTTTLGLGLVSSLFDNIPLTKLALDQGGYDWAQVAYSVGVGGSLLWFGSSAGVAVAGRFPEMKSVTRWLRDGWHVPVAFVVGFAALYVLHGWNP